MVVLGATKHVPDMMTRTMIFDAGLILEGGGMRGVYTAGVLDFFMDSGIVISRCYGVSAGAVNATNYLSKQRGRTFRITANYINDKRYCSAKGLLSTGDFFAPDFLYNRIPNELDPFDYETFRNSDSQMTAVVSNANTGEPEYKRIADLRKEMHWLRASCSLPLFANPVEIEGSTYVDGGMTDSIPLEKSMLDGNRKNIVVLTSHCGYQKKPEILAPLLGGALYPKYPRALEAGKRRHLMYNRQLQLVEEQERIGNAIVIRQKSEVKMGRAEKDIAKLSALYEQGYADAKEKLSQIMDFLQCCERSPKSERAQTEPKGTCKNCANAPRCELKSFGATLCLDWVFDETADYSWIQNCHLMRAK